MSNSVFIKYADILGQFIKAMRTALGIKLADCAALCGIGINTLSRTENGNSNCTLAAVFSVLSGFGIPLTSKELMQATPSWTQADEWD